MMLRNVLLAGIASLVLIAPSHAATVFADDFSAETPELNALLDNFDVTGQVDVVGASNPFGITTPGGNVVDLAGSPGPGEITSKLSYSFAAGDSVTLNMLVGGAQRGGTDDSLIVKFTFGEAVEVFDWFRTGNLGFLTVPSAGFAFGLEMFNTDLESTAPFVPTSMGFRAGNAGTLTFSIGTGSADRAGPLLASVSLDIVPAVVPLPAAGAVLLLGLGMLGALRGRRA